MELRSRHQNQIVTLQLTLTGAVFSFALTRPDLEMALLIVPISSYLLCGRYASQHGAIKRIARYIRDELSARVPGGFGWEHRIRAEPRKDRLLGWFLPFMLAFPGASVVALAWTSELVYAERQISLASSVPAGAWLLGSLGTVFSCYLLLRIYFARR
jgi:hypothetical protein